MIDVSEYQGTVDWHAVRSVHTHAMVKATEGVGRIDAFFARNAEHARKAGVTIGLYHFARPWNAPHREAAFFLRAAKAEIRAGDVVPHLDLERTEGHSWEYLNDWKAQWFAAIDAEIGTRAGFYSYYYFWKQMKLYPDRPVWGAATGSAFVTPKSWWAHQFIFTGTAPGVDGHVDLDRVLKDVPLIP